MAAEDYSASDANSLGLSDLQNEETNFIFGNANSLSQSATQTPTQTATATSGANSPAESNASGAGAGSGATGLGGIGSSAATIPDGGGGVDLTEVLLIALGGMLLLKFFEKTP